VMRCIQVSQELRSLIRNIIPDYVNE